MKLVAVSGHRNNGVTIVTPLIGSALGAKVCYLDVFEVLKCILPPIATMTTTLEDCDAFVDKVIETTPELLTNILQLNMKELQTYYDYIILTNVRSSKVMEIVHHVGGTNVGIYRCKTFSVPYSIRDRMDTRILGSPDYAIENDLTITSLRQKVNDFVKGWLND